MKDLASFVSQIFLDSHAGFLSHLPGDHKKAIAKNCSALLSKFWLFSCSTGEKTILPFSKTSNKRNENHWCIVSRVLNRSFTSYLFLGGFALCMWNSADDWLCYCRIFNCFMLKSCVAFTVWFRFRPSDQFRNIWLNLNRSFRSKHLRINHIAFVNCHIISRYKRTSYFGSCTCPTP